MGGYEPIFIQPILTHTTKFKKIQLQTTNRMFERFIYKRFCLNEMYATIARMSAISVIAGIYTVAGANA